MIKVVNKRAIVEGEYIGRPSVLGNPFIIGRDGDRNEVIAKYREWLLAEIPKNKEVTWELNRLWAISKCQDLTLVCWCAPKLCHGDVIKEILQEDY